MKVKVSEASGAVLDWMVAKCEGIKLCLAPFPGAKNFVMVGYSSKGEFATSHQYIPSTNWAQGGPIIERESLTVKMIARKPLWVSYSGWTDSDAEATGPTPLIAAMRCYCCSKLGDEVEIPKELTTN